jgi:hypothetical protein
MVERARLRLVSFVRADGAGTSGDRGRLAGDAGAGASRRPSTAPRARMRPLLLVLLATISWQTIRLIREDVSVTQEITMGLSLCEYLISSLQVKIFLLM